MITEIIVFGLMFAIIYFHIRKWYGRNVARPLIKWCIIHTIALYIACQVFWHVFVI